MKTRKHENAAVIPNSYIFIVLMLVLLIFAMFCLLVWLL